MLARTILIAVMLLMPVKIVLAQASGIALPATGNQACPQPRPDSAPKLIGGVAAAPDDTKLPGGGVACATTGVSNEVTRTDPGSGVMTTSPTGMMTNPGLQPMPDAPKTNPPK
jgi:hypothetical protein